MNVEIVSKLYLKREKDIDKNVTFKRMDLNCAGLVLYFYSGLYFFVRICSSVFCGVCCSLRGRKDWCLNRLQRQYYILQRGVKQLRKETDLVKVVRRLRMYNDILKSSLVCDKQRRQLLKQTRANVVNAGTETEYETDKEDFVMLNLSHEQG